MSEPSNWRLLYFIKIDETYTRHTIRDSGGGGWFDGWSRRCSIEAGREKKKQQEVGRNQSDGGEREKAVGGNGGRRRKDGCEQGRGRGEAAEEEKAQVSFHIRVIILPVPSLIFLVFFQCWFWSAKKKLIQVAN